MGKRFIVKEFVSVQKEYIDTKGNPRQRKTSIFRVVDTLCSGREVTLNSEDFAKQIADSLNACEEALGGTNKPESKV